MDEAGNELKFRLLNEDDAKLLYEWVSDAETRKNAPDPEPFSYENHLRWVKEKVQDEKNFIFIGMLYNVPVGQIRFDFQSRNFVVLSFIISPDYRGQGIGTRLVKTGIEELLNRLKNDVLRTGQLKIVAKVKNNNDASSRIFKKNGFEFKSEEVYNGSLFYVFGKNIEVP